MNIKTLICVILMGIPILTFIIAILVTVFNIVKEEHGNKTAIITTILASMFFIGFTSGLILMLM